MSSNESLKEIAVRTGFRDVPEVLAAAATPIERGHHLALAAGRGSGDEAVYAMAVAHGCDAASGLQALVLVPTRDRAAEVSLAIQRSVEAAGLRVGTAPLRADGSLDALATPLHCLVARPSVLLPEIRLGRLSLAGLGLLVLDGVADLVDLDEWTSVGPVLETLDGSARRVAVTRRVDDHFRELVRRQLPRGRRWPESEFEEAGAEASDPGDGPHPGELTVVQGATVEERIGALVDSVAGASEVGVRCRSLASIPLVRAALASHGLAIGDAVEPWDVLATAPEADEGAAPLRVWFGLPLSLDVLAAAPGERAVAIVDSSHASQLEILARRAGSTLRYAPGRVPTTELDLLGRYRSIVRARIERGGTDAELLVLHPLVQEFGTARVAAALSDLLRRSGGGDSMVRPWPDVEAASRGAEKPSRGAETPPASGTHRGARGAWSRVFIGAGNRDSVRVGDLVGAITGETGIAGAQIGKIEIRGSFSLVEIDSQVVDRVIEKLNGTAIRGREVTVKHDRGR